MKAFTVRSSCKQVGLPDFLPAARDVAKLPLWKRAIDLACCLAALPVFLLCTLIAAVVTAIASPGPIFFRQERVGYKGRRFNLYKFRTMHVRAETGTHQMHFDELVRKNVPMRKLDGRGDKRLIPGGRWFRASGLDELPQLINVLRGEMSLVGPRPCIPYEYARYTPMQRERFDAVPGLTGLWQVSGKNRTTFEEMIQLDIRYARTLSLGLELKIIFRTLPALWRQVAELRNPDPVPAANSATTAVARPEVLVAQVSQNALGPSLAPAVAR